MIISQNMLTSEKGVLQYINLCFVFRCGDILSDGGASADSRWRLDRGYGGVTYQRLRGALEALGGEDEGGGALSNALRFVVASHPVADTGAALHLPPVRNAAAHRGVSVASQFPLNADQRSLIQAALSSRITLLQGENDLLATFDFPASRCVQQIRCVKYIDRRSLIRI
jgi:hypothetical protein